MVDIAQNALSVVESAGNGVAKVTKAEDAQNELEAKLKQYMGK